LVQRNLVQVVPVVLFFILIAGMFSVVLIPVNIEIYGTVTDDEGNPLDHVYMEVYKGGGGLKVAEGGVDSQGHFSLFVHHQGEYDVWAWMQSGYWAQFQKVKFEPQDNNIRQEMDFQLVRNIICNVTLIASYWSVNSSHTLISFGYTQTGAITTLVHCVNLDDPFNSAVTYETHGTISGSGGPGWGGYGHFEQRSISGSYSTTPGEVVSLYLLKDSSSTGTDGPVPATDYLSPQNAIGGWIEVVYPEDYREVRVNADYNYTLPDALSIPVDVDILGKYYQTTLQCTMLDPGPSALTVWVGVTNLDSVPHSYEFCIEGGHIIHVWEVS
jgi:hypothetical protein